MSLNAQKTEIYVPPPEPEPVQVEEEPKEEIQEEIAPTKFTNRSYPVP